MTLARLNPTPRIFRGVIPQKMKVPALGFGKNLWRPSTFERGRLPIPWIILFHHTVGIDPFGAKFSTPEVPTRLHRQPTPCLQGSKVDSVPDIPAAVAVIVRHSVRGGRIIIPVDTLDHPVWIFLPYGFDPHGEHPLHLISENKTVWLGGSRRPGFVDEGDKNV